MFPEAKTRQSCWSTFAGNRALLPSDVIVRDFGGKQFYCHMSSDLEVINESACF